MYVLSVKTQNELAFLNASLWKICYTCILKHDKHTIMLLNLTEEQIAQLAPDAASVKRRKLANRTKWVLLEHSDRASGDTAKEVEKRLIKQ